MGPIYQPWWMKVIMFPLKVILIPFAIIYLIITKDSYCSECHKIIWRNQKSVRIERPFICEDGNNYPYINCWHMKCYKIKELKEKVEKMERKRKKKK